MPRHSRETLITVLPAVGSAARPLPSHSAHPPTGIEVGHWLAPAHNRARISVGSVSASVSVPSLARSLGSNRPPPSVPLSYTLSRTRTHSHTHTHTHTHSLTRQLIIFVISLCHIFFCQSLGTYFGISSFQFHLKSHRRQSSRHRHRHRNQRLS